MDILLTVKKSASPRNHTFGCISFSPSVPWEPLIPPHSREFFFALPAAHAHRLDGAHLAAAPARTWHPPRAFGTAWARSANDARLLFCNYRLAARYARCQGGKGTARHRTGLHLEPHAGPHAGPHAPLAMPQGRDDFSPKGPSAPLRLRSEHQVKWL